MSDRRIFVDRWHSQAAISEALAIMTPKWIDDGKYCTRTLIDCAAAMREQQQEIERLLAVLTAAQDYFTAYTDEINVSDESFSVYLAANKRKNEAWLRLREATDAAGGNE